MHSSLSIFQDQLLSWFFSCIPGCYFLLQLGYTVHFSHVCPCPGECLPGRPASPLHTNGCRVSVASPNLIVWPLKTDSAYLTLIWSKVSLSPPLHQPSCLPPHSHCSPTAPSQTVGDGLLGPLSSWPSTPNSFLPATSDGSPGTQAPFSSFTYILSVLPPENPVGSAPCPLLSATTKIFITWNLGCWDRLSSPVCCDPDYPV